jgi:nucleoside-diphosphate-sugar epimerase
MKDPTAGAALRVGSRILITPGTPDKRLPLVYIEDLVKILIAIADTDAAVGRVYNVIHPEMPTVTQYLELYRKLSGVRRAVVSLPVRKLLPLVHLLDKLSTAIGSTSGLGYAAARFVSSASYSADLIRRELGLEPKVGFRDGLQRLCRQAA